MRKALLSLFLFCLTIQNIQAQEPAFKLSLKEVPIEEVKKRELIEFGYLNKGFIAEYIVPLDYYRTEQAVYLANDYLDSLLIQTIKVKLFLDTLPQKVRLSIYIPSQDGEPGNRLVSELAVLDENLKRNTLVWDLRYYQLLFPKEGIFVGISNAGKILNGYYTPKLMHTVQVDSNLMYERKIDGNWKASQAFPTMNGKHKKWWNAKVNVVLKEL
jgi:hypothetical protein